MPHTTFSESILGKMVGQYRGSCSTALSFFLLIYHTNTAMIQIRMHSLAGIFFLVCFWAFQPFLLNRTVKQTGKERKSRNAIQEVDFLFSSLELFGSLCHYNATGCCYFPPINSQGKKKNVHFKQRDN